MSGSHAAVRRNLKDSSDHFAAHVEIESEIKNLKDSVKVRLSSIEKSIGQVGSVVSELRDEVIKNNAHLEFVPSKDELSNKVSDTLLGHINVYHKKKSIPPLKPQEINWKAIGAMVTGIIIAISGLVVAVIKAMGG